MRKKRSHRVEQLELLEEGLLNNGTAQREHKNKKNLTMHDLKSIKAMNEPQKQMMESFYNGLNLIASGSAGGGKSYMALFLALQALFTPNSTFTEVKIVRSAVASREIGHLPGTSEEKLEVYEIPYRDIVNDLLRNAKAYDSLKELNKISFTPTSFVRGLTWNNTIVIFDEAQSANFHEISSVVTRLGKNSKLIICGDTKQNDLIYKKNDVSGILDLLRIASKMQSFDVIEFTTNDIVRSGFVKEWLTVCEELL